MRTRTTGGLLVLVGLVLLSLNLRPAAVSVGPVLTEIRGALGMSGTTAGVLTSLPSLAFAVFGAVAPAAARRVGLHRLMLLALGLVALGLVARGLATTSPAMIGWSVVALAGMAVANVLLPSLAKLHFPDRMGTVTAVYTSAMGVAMAGALMVTAPIAEATGSWRLGLIAWAGVAVVAALPWLGLVAHDRAMEAGGPRLAYLAVLRTPIGLTMALLFGLQSTQAYIVAGWFATLWRDEGFTAGQAGLLVGVVTGAGVPLALVVPPLLARVRDARWLLLAVLAGYPVGYALLIAAPHALAIPAALALSVGLTMFPVVLLLIGMRARTAAGTATLSSTTQSVGYLIGAGGPFLFGFLHDLTGGWSVPLVTVACLVVPMTGLVVYLGRERYVEDQVR